MPIYDRTTRDLMHDFAKERLKPGQVFSRQDAVGWFRERYPKIKSNTVSIHVDGMSINNRMRVHHAHIREGIGWDLFYKLSPKQFRLWNAASDPAPVYKHTIEDEVSEFTAIEADVDESDDELSQKGQSFAFERDLQNYLAKNLGQIESGLRLYEDEDGVITGIEYPVGQRRIDILALSKDGTYVVIETKVAQAYDRVIGQILRYMAWVKANLAEGNDVRGIIVAHTISDDLRLAASLIDGVSLVEYKIAFSLSKVGM